MAKIPAKLNKEKLLNSIRELVKDKEDMERIECYAGKSNLSNRIVIIDKGQRLSILL